jgi:hypothetical protein
MRQVVKYRRSFGILFSNQLRASIAQEDGVFEGREGGIA